MIILRRTVSPTGDDPVTLTSTTITGNCSTTDGEAADYIDGDADTGTLMSAAGVGGGEVGDMTLLEEWLLDVSSLSDDDLITSVKFYITYKQINSVGTAGSSTLTLSINGTADDVVSIPGTDLTTTAWESFVDPADSAVWTKTKLTDQSFGWYAELTTADDSSTTQLSISEFYAEIYVDQPYMNPVRSPEIREIPHSVQMNQTPSPVWQKLTNQWMGIRQKRGRRS